MALDLKDFISATIQDVLEDISQAQASQAVGRNIAPAALSNLEKYTADSGVYAGQRLLSTTIKFDVSLSAEDKGSVGGKAGVKIYVATASIDGQTESKSGSTHRIQFAVPVTFPGPPGLKT